LTWEVWASRHNSQSSFLELEAKTLKLPEIEALLTSNTKSCRQACGLLTEKKVVGNCRALDVAIYQ
jgi:hypothetical protein